MGGPATAGHALLGVTLALLGCARPAEAPRASASTPAPVDVTSLGPGGTASPPSPSAPAPATSGQASLPSTVALCSASAPAALSSPTEFTQLHAGRVLSAAVGTPPRAAVWSGESATLFEGESPRELPAPRLPAGANVEIFFGRDNQPRLMGFAPGEAGKEVPVYLRFRQGVFRPEPSELGPLGAPLGAPRGALYGVLGFEDPEVVCRPRELCLVKRTSGWARVAAHEAPVRIVLRGESVFALHSGHIERLGGRGWSKLEPTRAFEQPLDVWPAPTGELWVVDRSALGLYRLKGGNWEVVESPVSEPRAVLARSERSLFVVGKNGAAESDGSSFRCIRGLNGPLHLALAVGDDVWLAGESGLYRSGR